MLQNKKSSAGKRKRIYKKNSTNLQQDISEKKYSDQKPQAIIDDSDFHHDHSFINPNQVGSK